MVGGRPGTYTLPPGCKLSMLRKLLSKPIVSVRNQPNTRGDEARSRATHVTPRPYTDNCARRMRGPYVLHASSLVIDRHQGTTRILNTILLYGSCLLAQVVPNS
jgi:hypothetical protein